jgi:hypothetical protein
MSKPRRSGQLLRVLAQRGRLTDAAGGRELRLAKCWPPEPAKSPQVETKKQSRVIRPK